MPDKLKDKLFEKVFQTAEIAKMDKQELFEYEESLKRYRDLKNSLDCAKAEGLAEGLAEGIEKGREEGIAEGLEKGIAEGIEKGIAKGKNTTLKETAQKMKELGMDISTIQKVTGLSEKEITNL
eukprot:TRINITY_DN2752_c0_g1_i5.p1 TRINITY_DN2752_c0_g1~~TRINITY_DN2752_c0_g1_i5.p1  ORF type:complete len:124 (-),score=11.71 TRINITY_DN2752_c0_g1_i5:281-652(-)